MMIKYFVFLLILINAAVVANAQIKPKETNTDIVKTIALSPPEEINKYIKSGQDVNLRDFRGNTILQFAVNGSEYPDVVNALINAGADVNAANASGLTSLMIATRQANNYEYGISQMLDNPELKGIDVYKVIAENNRKNLQIVKSLLDAGAEINLSNDDGTTPLMYAVTSNSNNEIVKLMIERQVLINQINDKGENALIYAIRYSSAPEETIKILLKGGIDINRRDVKGKTAYDYALKRGILSEETLKLIIPTKTKK